MAEEAAIFFDLVVVLTVEVGDVVEGTGLAIEIFKHKKIKQFGRVGPRNIRDLRAAILIKVKLHSGEKTHSRNTSKATGMLYFGHEVEK